jgi:hypothetical protein
LAQEGNKVPEATLLDLFQGFFHRQDKLLEYMAETQKQILVLIRAMSGVPPVLPPVLPSAPGVTVEVSGMTEEAFEKFMKMPLPVMAYPLGRVKKKGSLSATTTSYVTVCEITVTEGKEFQLGNLSISADQDILCKLMWQDKALTPVFYVMGKLPFDKFFLPHYMTDEGKALVGDGKSKLQLQACYPTGGTASTYCEGEIVGDEL